MSKIREKAEAQTEQIIGQMLGDELLVREGQERLRNAETESGADRRTLTAHDKAGPDTKPGSEPDRAEGADQGIVRDERGQEQPKDKARARQVSRVDKGNDPPGKRT